MSSKARGSSLALLYAKLTEELDRYRRSQHGTRRMGVTEIAAELYSRDGTNLKN